MKILHLLPFLLILLSQFNTFSQERISAEFKHPTQDDFNIASYNNDPNAPGVILYEKGINYMKSIGDEIKLIKEVHKKIKVFNANKFNHSEVEIYYYHTNENSERVIKLEALTHNGEEKDYVSNNDIFTINESTNWSKKKFTFPKVKNGSILEYKYTIESSFFFNFGGWDFQHEIPTLYSDFESKIPGNYLYHRSLIGRNKLDINNTFIKQNCFNINDIRDDGDCEVSIYVMKNIPAFKEEKYMLSAKNYISSVQFELQELIYTNGVKRKFSKEWKDVDKEFKFEYNLGRQLKHKNFFKGKLPDELLTISDSLEKAKGIFNFIKTHYTWNGKNSVFSDKNIKNAYNSKLGTSTEINLSLINALNAAGLNSKLVLLSTRDQKLPNKDYPIISEFNYVIALLNLNGNEYLLDASNKFNSFNLLLPKTLNIRARVMDFKKGSYWLAIPPNKRNITYSFLQLKLNEDNVFKGKLDRTFTGYAALQKREEIANLSKDDIIKNFEELNVNIEVKSYANENVLNTSKNLKEIVNISLDYETISNNILFTPNFLQTEFIENPFKLNERNFPIDFGYPFEHTYIVNIDLNDQYEFIKTPKSRSLKLPQDSGVCSIIYTNTPKNLKLVYKLKLNDYLFNPEAYPLLKEFFSNISDVISKDQVLINKI